MRKQVSPGFSTPLKYILLMHSTFHHILQKFERITAVGDRRITAEGDVRITADSA